MIKNKGELLKGEFKRERGIALQIIEAGLRAVDVRGAVKKAKLPGLGKFKNIYVIGFGKASAAMAEALEKRLGGKISKGAVVSVRKAGTKRIKGFKGSHPIPSVSNVKAAREILRIAENAGHNDLVIALVSGGGSSLLTLPADGITLREIQKITSLLVKSKAGISEINAVRKHLSRVKGGRLAEKVFPAKLYALIVSDVIGDSLSVIASGATVGDKSTLQQAVRVLKSHKLWSKTPKSIQRHLLLRGNETPKRVRNCENKIILNNETALKAMRKKAKQLRFRATIHSRELEGEAEHVGRFLVRKAVNLREKFKKPIALIAGGETTVTITGKGKGGRNQEIVLGALNDLGKAGKAVFISVGSDGIDGNSRAAGAIADSKTVAIARKKRLNPKKFLKRNDSNSFFRKVKGEIVTGYTETNVMDLQLVMCA